MRRPRLDGTGTADSAVPNSFNGSPVVLDAAGRITSLDGVALTYTRRGQLVSATKGATTVSYGLDSFYRRVSSESSVLSEFYVWEGDNVVATTNGATLVADRYFYDGVDHPLRMLRAGSATYFEIDLAGNVRRLRASGGGDLGGYRYTAFGKTYAATGTTPTPSVAQPLRWKARWLDGVTGLYDVRARQWAPGAGVFTEVDEYDFHDGTSTLWAWPNQNPIVFSDPSGRWFAQAVAFAGAVVYVLATGATVQSHSTGSLIDIALAAGGGEAAVMGGKALLEAALPFLKRLGPEAAELILELERLEKGGLRITNKKVRPKRGRFKSLEDALDQEEGVTAAQTRGRTCKDEERSTNPEIHETEKSKQRRRNALSKVRPEDFEDEDE